MQNFCMKKLRTKCWRNRFLKSCAQNVGEIDFGFKTVSQSRFLNSILSHNVLKMDEVRLRIGNSRLRDFHIFIVA